MTENNPSNQEAIPSSKVEVAETQKREGNAHFKAKRYPQAVTSYLRGLKCLEDDSANSDDGKTTETEEQLTQRRDLKVSLRSNLAGAFLKLEDFQEVDRQCTIVIEELNPNHRKVWYRRGLARERIAATHDSPGQILDAAADDLAKCLELLAVNEPEYREVQDALKKVRLTRARLVASQENSINNVNSLSATPLQSEVRRPTETQEERVGGFENGHSNVQKDVLAAHKLPIPQQQRQDIVRLLLARETSLLKTGPPIGEAFFLVDWRWWSSWCLFVDFFYTDETADESTISPKTAKVLKLLPKGAVVVQKKGRSTDSDSDDDSRSNGDDDDFFRFQRPSPIDNSALFLLPKRSQTSSSTKATFFGQWYSKTSRQSSDALRPNLVRGYHYEVLPREVYNALRSWYGEVTPSICRRTQHNSIYRQPVLKLYDYLGNSSEIELENKRMTSCAACHAPNAPFRCTGCLSVYYCDRTCQESHRKFHKARCKVAPKGRDSVTKADSGGRVGLNNMGNTCFMNSALQCLSHATPLTRLFLSKRFEEDINKSNPLGTGGNLAKAFNTVLREIWMMKGAGGTSSPTALKRAIALFAPRFAGCLQHDAQEFLAYLLDGLHEDLNRVIDAPYVEMPDVTDGQNMTIAGAEAWDTHLRRNDSLVMDTFYGQFKSTCVCPKCNRVSVSFDTFNHISLEIPQLHRTTFTRTILVFRDSANGRDMEPVRYGVSARRAHDIRGALSALCKVPPSNLVLCEIYESAIFKIIKDDEISSIESDDLIAAYEVDPYASTSIHAIVSHSLHDAEDKKIATPREFFGFPFVTSFAASMTCREVWDHMWKRVRHMVVDFAGANVERENQFKKFLKISILGDDRSPFMVFPSPVSADQNESGQVFSSFIPPHLDEKIASFLGKDCTSKYLFVTLCWSESIEVMVTGQNPHVVSLKPARFRSFVDHPSLIQALRVTLEQCLETFTKPERLDENNKWYCSKCKMHVRALKTMELWRLPNVLVIHLKRFEFRHGFRRSKLDSFVNFPLEGLDMRLHSSCWKQADGQDGSQPFMDDRVPATYDLFAVVNHYGRMGFGHYTAFARKWDECGMSKDWALFDDSSVRSVGDGGGSGSKVDSVVSPAAYVLFYRRRIFH